MDKIMIMNKHLKGIKGQLLSHERDIKQHKSHTIEATYMKRWYGSRVSARESVYSNKLHTHTVTLTHKHTYAHTQHTTHKHTNTHMHTHREHVRTHCHASDGAAVFLTACGGVGVSLLPHNQKINLSPFNRIFGPRVRRWCKKIGAIARWSSIRHLSPIPPPSCSQQRGKNKSPL